MKTKIFVFFSVFILTVVFLSCEVGLGSAVDTQSPELEIVFPRGTETIRGVFTLQGTYDDDGIVSKVEVSMSRANAINASPKTFLAKVDTKHKTWSCVINPLDLSDPIFDGTYNFNVAITDNGEHKTTKSTVLTLDNTAPVIALTRPGSAYSEDNGIWESYGQDFILTGNASDTCETKELVVKVYDINDLTTPLYTSDRTKVDSEFKLTVASFGDSTPESDELNAYKKIYYKNGNEDINVINEEKKFICSITAYDNAIEYLDDKGTTAATGNSREYFFLYNDEPLYSELFGKYGMFSAYKILSDTFDITSIDRTIDADEAEQFVKDLKEKILKNENQVKYAYFSLNPANNPSFLISGQDPLVADELDVGGHIFKTSNGERREDVSITKNTTIVVEVTPGLDLTALNGDSLGVYVQECDDDANIIGDKIYLIKPLISDIDGTRFEGLEKTDEEKRAAAIKFGDSKYKFTFKLIADSKVFVTGKNYILGVDGFDNKGVLVSNAVDKYGFFFSSGATAPIVTAESDVTWISIGENKIDSAPKNIKTDITIKNGDEPFVVVRRLYTKNKILIDEQTVKDKLEKESPDDSYISFTDTYVLPEILENGEYEVRYTVTDSNKVSGIANYSVKLDSSSPTVGKINTPTTNQTASASYRFTGEVSDDSSGIDTVEFRLIDESDENNVKQTDWIKASGTNSWEYTVVFTDSETETGGAKFSDIFATETWKKIEVRTYDKAGNYSSKGSTKFRFDKEFPELLVSSYAIKQDEKDVVFDLNGKLNFETKDNFSLSGMATDAFGIDSIRLVQISKVGDEEKKTPIDVDFDGLVWSVENLPRCYDDPKKTVSRENLSGVYSFEIAVTDMADKRTAKSVKSVIDIEPPVIEITSPGVNTKLEGSNSINDTYLFRGNVKDGTDGVGTQKYSYLFTQDAQPAADAVWTTVDNSGDGSWTIAKDVIAGTESDGSSALYEGHWYLFMNAEDIAGNKSENVQRNFWVDLSEPVIDSRIDENETCRIVGGTYYFDSDLTGRIIEVYDTHGSADGVKIYYQIDKNEPVELIGNEWQQGEFGNENQLAYGIKGAAWRIKKEVLENLDWTQKHEISITAVDKVGKKSGNKETIWFDNLAPVITVVSPAQNQLFNTKSISINGSIKEDGIGVDGGVEYVITKDGSILASGTAPVINESWRVNNVDLGAAEGDFAISLKAVDKLGNFTEIVNIPFVYDAGSPLLTETAVGTKSKITNSAITLSGKAKDTNKLASVVMKDDINQAYEWRIDVDENDSWSITIEPGNEDGKLCDGSHTLAITATDVVGNKETITRTVTVDTKSPAVTSAVFANAVLNLDESRNLMLEVEAADDDDGCGLKSVKYWFTEIKEITDYDAGTWESLLSSNNLWVKTVDFSGKSDGSYYAHIRAEDNAGNVTYGNVFAEVYVDTAKPVITVAGPSTAENNAVELSVEVKDFNPTSPVVTVTNSEGNSLVPLVRSTENANIWTVEIPFREEIEDSVYTVKVNATDTVGRLADQKSHTILKDSHAPVVNITGVDEFSKSENYEFKGIAEDLNLDSVKATLYKEGQTKAVSSTNLSTNQDNEWNWKVYELSDGKYKLEITAKDNAGHTTVKESSYLTVDLIAPNTTLELLSGNKFYTNDGVKLETGAALANQNSYFASASYKISGVLTEVNPDSVKINGSEVRLDSGKWEYTGVEQEGSSGIDIVITDKAGNRTEQKLTVKYDVTGPVIGVSVPAENELINTQKINLSGSVEDVVAGVSSVVYKVTKNGIKIDEGNASITNNSWTKKNVDLGNKEGNFKLSVTATDKIGNSTVIENIPFIFDIAAPLLSETEIPATDAGKTTNGGEDNKLTLRGTASDSNELKSVIITDSMNSASSWNVNVGENGNWIHLIELGNSKNQLAEGLHTLTITATDAADRQTRLTRNVTIDKQIPVVNSASFASGLFNKDQMNNMMLTVNASDNEGGTGVKAVSYYFAKEGYELTGSETWEALLPSGSNWVKTVDFGNTTDGTYFAFIKVEDNAGNITVSNVKAEVYVDTAIPVIAVTGPTAAENDTVTLNITVTDFNPTEPIVTVTDAEGHNITAIVGNETSVIGGKKWTAEIPFSSETADGTYTIIVNAQDTKGRAAVQKTHTILKDSVAPEVSIEGVATFAKVSNYEFRGSASDDNLESVKIELYKDGEKTGRNEMLSPDHENRWSWKVYELGDGTYNVKVSARDRAGHEAAVDSGNVTVDTTAPETSLKLSGEGLFDSEGNAVNSEITVVDGSTYFASAAFTVRGTATDDNLASVKVNGTAAEVDEEGNWSVNGTVANGDKKYTVEVTDLAGNRSSISVTVRFDAIGPVTTITEPETGYITGNGKINIRGTASDDGAGTKELKYWIKKDNETVATDTIDLTERNWSIGELELTGGEGNYSIDIETSDKLGNKSLLSGRNFYYDRAVPMIEETGIGSVNTTKNTAYVLSGSVSESNGLTSMEIEVDGYRENLVYNGNSTDGYTWTYVPEVYAEGEHTYIIRAKDAANRNAVEVTRKVLYDVTPPNVTSAEFGTSEVFLDVGQYDRLTVRGTDGIGKVSGIDTLSYILKKAGEGVPSADDAGWAVLSSSGLNYSETVNFTGKTDGTYYAYIKAEDLAGNVAISNIKAEVYVDTAIPVIAVTGPTAAENEAVILSVTVTDFNPTAPVVSVTDADGHNITAIVGNETSVMGGKKWTAEIPFSSETADGTYTIIVNAQDTQGRAAVQKTHTILKDSVAPEVSIEGVATFAKVSNYEFKGSASDDNLESVKIELYKDGEKTGRNEMLSPDHENRWSWKVYELGDGTYSVKVNARDRAGHEAAVDSGNVTVDTTAPENTIHFADSTSLYNSLGSRITEGSELTNGSTYYAKAPYTITGVIEESNFDAASGITLNATGGTTPRLNVNAESNTWSFNGISEAGEHTYSYTISVTDKAGNRTEKTITVVYDTNEPDLVLQTPAENESFINRNITLKGTVEDQGIGLKALKYSINGGEFNNISVNGKNWTEEIDLGETEGSFAITVKAEDKLGQESTIENRAFYFDNAAPELTLNGQTTRTESGNFTINGTVYETNGLSSVVIKEGNTVVANLTGLTGNNGNYTWTKTLETGTGAGKVGEGSHTYTIEATDIATKKSAAKIVTVTVDTAAPNLTNGTFVDDLIKLDESVLGNVTVEADDNGGTGLNTVQYYISNSEITVEAAKNLAANKWTSMNQGADNWNAAANFSGKSEGTYYVYFKANDNAGNVKIIKGTKSINVDKTAPKIVTEGSLINTNSTSTDLIVTVKDSNVHATQGLTAKVGDDLLSVSEARTVVGGKEYTVTVPMADGDEKTVELIAKDANERTATESVKFVCDISKPVITLAETYAEYTNAGSIEIKGTAKDSHINAGNVSVTLKAQGKTEKAGIITGQVTGTGDERTYSWIANVYGLENAEYAVEITATDSFGNTDTYSGADLHKVTNDTVKPTAQLTVAQGHLYKLDGSEATLGIDENVGGSTYYANNSFKIAGTVEETNYDATKITLQKGNGTPVQIGHLGKTFEYTWNYVDAATSDGENDYTLVLEDKAGNRSERKITVICDTTKPDLTVAVPADGESFSGNIIDAIKGTVADSGIGLGTDSITYVIKQTGKTDRTDKTAPVGRNWSFPNVSLGDDEGSFTITVTATDKLGNLDVIANRAFYFDKEPPVLTETTVNAPSVTINGAITFGGAVTETNGLDKIEIFKDGVATATATIRGSSITPVGNVYTWSKQFTATEIGDGNHTYTIKATDIAGKVSATITRAVMLDTVKPSLTSGKFVTEEGETNAMLYQDKASYANVTVDAEDNTQGSGISKVYYLTTASNAAQPQVDDAAWTAMSQGMQKAWNSAINCSAYTEGKYKVWFKAQDIAGNVKIEEGSNLLTIDAKEPSIKAKFGGAEVTSFTANAGNLVDEVVNGVTEKTLTFTVEVTDTNVASTDGLTAAGGKSGTTPVVTAGSYVSGVKTYTVKTYAITDGNANTITLTAKDENGRTVTKNVTFSCDIVKPEITINTYDSFTNKDSVEITGKIKEKNFSSVEVELVNTANASDKKTATISLKNDDTDATGETKLWTAKIYELSDAIYSVKVTAKDTYNNTQNTTGSRNITIDPDKPTTSLSIVRTDNAANKIYDANGVAVTTFVDGGTYYAGGAYKITGVVTETNYDYTETKYKLGDGSQTVCGNSSDKTWTIAGKSATDGTEDGKYTYTIYMKDKAENPNTVTVYVVYDTKGPELSITNPDHDLSGSDSISGSSYTFRGTVGDGNGSGIPGKKFRYYFTPDRITGTTSGESNILVQARKATAESGWTETTGDSLTKTYEIIEGTTAAFGKLQEGQGYLYIYAKDAVGNESYVERSFWVDKYDPKITLDHVTTPTKGDASGAVTISGKAEDANGITSLTITLDGASVGYDSFSSGNFSKELTGLGDGSHTVKIEATDAATKKSDVSVTFVYDTKAPKATITLAPLTGESFYYETASKKWVKASQKINVSVDVDDSNDTAVVAGIKEVEIVAVKAADTPNFTTNTIQLRQVGNTSTYTGTITLDQEGENRIYVKVTDNADNSNSSKYETIWLDATAPDVCKVYDVATGGTEFTGTKYNNGDSDTVVYVEAGDVTGGTGIKSVAYKGGTAVTTAETGGRYKITIPKAHSGSVEFDVIDKAGNKTTLKTFEYRLDGVAPSTEIYAIDDADESTSDKLDVNGTFVLKGTSSDNLSGVKAIAQDGIVLKYKTGDAETDKPANATAWASINKKFTVTGTPSNWTASIDTVTLNKDGKYLFVKAFATDEAGNIGSGATDSDKSEMTLFINQDSDRPIITFTNVDLTNPAAVWLKNSKRLQGTISDDDGLNGLLFQYKDATVTGDTWHNVTKQNSGSWYIPDIEDGSHEFLFKVMDVAKPTPGTYESKTSKLPKLTSELGGTPITTGDVTLKFSVDGTKPSYKDIKFKVDSEGYKNGSSITFGGINDKFEVKLTAGDKNGIKSVTINFNGQNYTATKNGTETPDEDGIKWADWTYSTSGGIPIPKLVNDSLFTGSKQVKITVVDNADIEYESIELINVDNEAPEIKFTSHKNDGTDIVYATEMVTVRGTAPGDISKMYYAVTNLSSAPAFIDKTHTSGFRYNESGFVFDTDVASRYPHGELEASTGITMMFDGGSDLGAEKHLSKLNEVICKMEGIDIAQLANTDNLRNVYLWAFGVDEAGNISVPTALHLQVIPNGDKPTVAFVNPAENNTSVGGRIRISGTANIYQDEIDAVYVQINQTTLASGTDFNDSMFGTGNAWKTFAEGLADGYTVEQIFTDSQAQANSNKKLPYQYGIKVNGTASWNFTLNNHSGLNSYAYSAETPNIIMLRIFAVSKTNKNVSDPVVRYIKIDPNSPTIEDVELVKADGSRQEYISGMWIKGKWTLQASIKDTSGIRKITVTSPDLVSDSNASGTVDIVNDGAIVTDYSSWVTEMESVGSLHNYDIKIPVGSETRNSFGSLNYTIYAEDGSDPTADVTASFGMNYDNKNPVITPDKSVTAIQNSNGTYYFKGTFAEASDEKGNQSGFKQIAMYFTRTLDTGDSAETYVIDPMLSGTYDSTKNPGETGEFAGTDGRGNFIKVSDSDISSADGLYWMKRAVTITGNNTLTFASGETINRFIRKGNQVKIDNVLYKILNVDYATKKVSIDGSVTNTDTAKDVYFALAQIIDNTKVESGKTAAYNFTTRPEIPNDDDDQMVEGCTGTDANIEWQAGINTNLILDGQVKVNFVAYDKAGNTAVADYDASISNNAPRLYGVKYATDENADGSITDGSGNAINEWTTYQVGSNGKPIFTVQDLNTNENYYGYTGDINSKDAVTEITIPTTLKVKGNIGVIPLIAGGNVGLGYTTPISSTITKFGSVGHNDSADGKSKRSDTEQSSMKIELTLEDILTKEVDTENHKTLADTENQTLEFKVWDYTDGMEVYTTTETATTKKRNVVTVKLPVTMAIKDEVPPVALIKPFYWTSASVNSLFRNSKDNGHIELEDDWKNATGYSSSATSGIYDSDPKVSGIITVEGVAIDNVVVKKLYAQIDGYNSDEKFLIAERTSETDATWKSEDAAHLVTSAVTALSTDWAFEFVSESYDEYGSNTVNFKFHFNTAKISGVAAADRKIVFMAQDRGVPKVTGSDISYEKANYSNIDIYEYGTVSTDITNKYYKTNTDGILSDEITAENKPEDSVIVYKYKAESQTSKATVSAVWADVKNEAAAQVTYFTDSALAIPVVMSGENKTADTATVYKMGLTGRYQVDVVPYVTKVYTAMSALQKREEKWSVTSRTSNGHYPVRVVVKDLEGATSGTSVGGETIKLYGFNLTGAQYTPNGGSAAELSAGSGSDTYGNYVSINASTLKATSAEASGALELKVSGIPTLNNLNDNEATGNPSVKITQTNIVAGTKTYSDVKNLAYNRQPNGDSNNILTDDLIFDVWEFNSAAAVPISGKIEQPVMKIRPTDGKIGFAFVNGPLYFSMGGSETSQDYSYQYWLGSFDFFSSVGFHYDDLGNSWGVAAGGDINATTGDKFSLMSSKFGIGDHYDGASRDGNNIIRMERIAQRNASGVIDFDKQAYKSPALASTIHGNNTNLYLAYYDGMNNQIRFKAGNYSDYIGPKLLTIGEEIGVVQVKRSDNTRWQGVWVDRNTNIESGNLCQVCDENGTILNDTIYRIDGIWNGFDGFTAFTTYDDCDMIVRPAPGLTSEIITNATERKESDINFLILNDDDKVYLKVYKGTITTNTGVKGKRFGDFIDDKIDSAPSTVEHASVSMIAGSNTGKNPGQYVALGAIPGTTDANDTVVVAWYDETERQLMYSYTTTSPMGRAGQTDFSGWSTPVAVFENTDYDTAGEYCKIAVDKDNGVHIAAYDPTNLDLVYAYLPASKVGKGDNSSDFKTCIVDGNGVVGSNLTLDVGKVSAEGNVVPYIGYYATSSIRPKIAYFKDGFVEDADIITDGSVDDSFTGAWECSIVPTNNTVEMQSNQHNDINIGVWKNDGVIIDSTDTTHYKTGAVATDYDAAKTSTYNSVSGYNSSSYGQVYGNGTKNAVLGYAVKHGASGDNIETAQMR